jgi:hypothetical protein
MALSSGKIRKYVRDKNGRFATTGGSSSGKTVDPKSLSNKDQAAFQRAAAKSQKINEDILASGDHGEMGSVSNPAVVLGLDLRQSLVTSYLKQNGAVEKQGSPLPKDVRKGQLGQCYANASKLVLDHGDKYDYAEGYAQPKGSPFAYLHGWAVDKKSGQVVDRTWDNPQDAKYYGVTYDRQKYISHIARTGHHGVLGGSFESAVEVLKKGGIK